MILKRLIMPVMTILMSVTGMTTLKAKQILDRKDARVSLEFIGEDILHTGFLFQDIEVGGLSGIEFDKNSGKFLAISDDRASNGPARFYDLDISLHDGYLDSGDVTLTQMTEILDINGESFLPADVDPESIRLADFPGILYWTSEGDANTGQAPFVRVMTRNGQHLAEFSTPQKFFPTKNSGIRNNLAFESLSFSTSGLFLFTATENALIQDGETASLEHGSPVRVLKFSVLSGEPVSEFIYQTDPIAAAPIPTGSFATNGLVELLSVAPQKFIAVERSFSVGVGNSIKLYLTTTKGATDVSDINSIEGATLEPMKKRLIFDLAALGITLDNIEGITLGPKLPTGEPTLVLVSDNNFNPNGQFTQFLAFKVNGL